MKKSSFRKTCKSTVALMLIITIVFSSITSTPKAIAAPTLFDLVLFGYSAYECGTDPNLITCGGAIADLALLVVPFVPSVAGMTARSVRVANKTLTISDDTMKSVREAKTVEELKKLNIPIAVTATDLREGKTIWGKVRVLRSYFTKDLNGEIHAHHINSQKLCEALGFSDEGDMLGLVLKRDLHVGKDVNLFTTKMNRVIKKYQNTDGSYSLAGKQNQYIKDIHNVYSGFPALQYAAISEFLKSPTGAKWLLSLRLKTATVMKITNMLSKSVYGSHTEQVVASAGNVEEIINILNQEMPAPYERINLTDSSQPAPNNQPSQTSNPSQPSQNSPSYVTNQQYNRANFDKGKYTGDWSNNAPHGYGTLLYDSDNRYKITFSGGSSYRASKYVGNWSNGQKYGQGVLTFANGDSFDGDWNMSGIYFSGYFVDVNKNKRKVKKTVRADGVTVDFEWIGDWEYVNTTPDPAPAPSTNTTPEPPPKNPEPTQYSPPQTSGWTQIEDMPQGATVTERKWTYSVADTFESTKNSIAGATKTSERWAQEGSGSREYAHFPSGFDTSHSIYRTYDKAPVAAYDNGSSKREVTDSHSGYIYWHWTYEPGSPTSSVDNRYIQSYRGYDSGTGLSFVYFHAVVSNQNYPFDAGANACKWNGGGSYWSWWWYKLDLRRSDYVDYTKYYTYSRTQEVESTSYPSGNNITNIQEWVTYTLPQQISQSVEAAPSSYTSRDEDAAVNRTEVTTSYTTERDASERNTTKRNKRDLPAKVTADERYSTTVEEAATVKKKQHIKLYIGSPQMDTPNGRIPIDENGTSPIVQNGRTLLPIRAIIESMGGVVEWDDKSNPNLDKVTCDVANYNVQMWIGYSKYYVNDKEFSFDVSPQVINSRTMIPARALFEAIGCEVDWKENVSNGFDMVTITYWA